MFKFAKLFDVDFFSVKNLRFNDSDYCLQALLLLLLSLVVCLHNVVHEAACLILSMDFPIVKYILQ